MSDLQYKSSASQWPARLRRALMAYFDEADIQTLCFDLGIDYDNLPGGSKSVKIVELIEYLARLGKIPELIDHCSQYRPNVPWGELREAAVRHPLVFEPGKANQAVPMAPQVSQHEPPTTPPRVSRLTRFAQPGLVLIAIGLITIVVIAGALGLPRIISPPAAPGDAWLTPNPSELLEAARAWPIVVVDTFDTDKGIWRVGDSGDEGRTTERYIIDGKYRWEITCGKDGFMPWTIPYHLDPLSNFYLTVEAGLVSGPESETRYGVLFRRQGQTFYTFRIEDGPNFRVRLWRQGEWTNLIDFTRVSGVRAGESNRLTVIAEGSRFLFYVDDRCVGEVNDASLAMGNVGLIVYIGDAVDKAILEFDSFELRSRPQPGE
jgi:hypothetical protein